MHSFLDADGKRWSIAIDIHAARRIRSAVGMPIESLVDPNRVQQWDRVALFDALVAAINKDEAELAVVLADPDVAQRAADALVEEAIDFLPQQQRSLMRSLLAKTKKMTDATAEAMPRLIDKQVDEVVSRLQSYSSFTSPVSPESIPPAGTSQT